MASLLWEKQIIACDLEATYGTAPASMSTPTATLFLACMDPVVTCEGEVVNRNFINAYLSRTAHSIGKRKVTLKFKTELSKIIASLATYTNVPMEARLWQAAGLAETGTTVKTYTVSSTTTNHKSVSFKHFIEGMYFPINGAVCEEAKIMMPVGAPYYVEWTFKGLYATPVDGAFATATPPIYNPKVLALTAGQPNYITGYFPSDIEISIKNTLAERPEMNLIGQIGKFVIVNRNITLKTNIESVLLATKDHYAAFMNGTSVSMSFTSIFPSDGSSNEIQILSPTCQLTKAPSPINRDGVVGINIEASMNASAITTGDDEFSIVYN